MTPLDDLIAAVEVGTMHDGHVIRTAIVSQMGGRVVAAFTGDLNAALRLHEALLPGTGQYSIVTDPTCLCVKVAWWPKGLSGGVEIHGEGWDEGNAARAWLLAILRALKAKEGRE